MPLTDAELVGWDSKEQQLRRFRIVEKYVSPGSIVIDIGAGYGSLGDYLLSKMKVNYIPVEPSPRIYPHLYVKYPHAIYASIFSPDLKAQLQPYLPADVVCAIGVIAELKINRLNMTKAERESLFIKRLLSIPSKYVIFDFWDAFFFRRRGTTDSTVNVSNPGEILNYTESNLKTTDKIVYFRDPDIDKEASFIIVTRG